METNINELNDDPGILFFDDYSINGKDFCQVIRLSSHDYIYVIEVHGIVGFTHTNGDFLSLDRFE